MDPDLPIVGLGAPSLTHRIGADAAKPSCPPAAFLLPAPVMAKFQKSEIYVRKWQFQGDWLKCNDEKCTDPNYPIRKAVRGSAR